MLLLNSFKLHSFECQPLKTKCAHAIPVPLGVAYLA